MGLADAFYDGADVLLMRREQLRVEAVLGVTLFQQQLFFHERIFKSQSISQMRGAFACFLSSIALKSVTNYYFKFRPSMLGKMWQNIQGWIQSFNGGGTPDPVLYLRKPARTRFLVQGQPQAPPPEEIKDSSAPQVQPIAKEEQTIYQITEPVQEKTKEQEEEEIDNENFLREMRQVNLKVSTLSLGGNDLPPPTDIKRVENIIKQIKKVNYCSEDEEEIYESYKRNVAAVLLGKYSGELKDYPAISYEEYKPIDRLWKMKGRGVESAVEGCRHLKVKDIKFLAQGEWLNDEVISEYISLLKDQVEKNQESQIKILNSLQVSSFFENNKYDPNKVTKFFGKQKIAASHSIIFAVHKINHWIFLVLRNNSLLIYDSMCRPNANDYLKFPAIRNIHHYASYWSGETVQVRIVGQFPQQRNGYDCGMMMLCGMKDLVRGRGIWSFQQQDIPYKRVLMAKQLMEHHLQGF